MQVVNHRKYVAQGAVAPSAPPIELMYPCGYHHIPDGAIPVAVQVSDIDPMVGKSEAAVTAMAVAEWAHNPIQSCDYLDTSRPISQELHRLESSIAYRYSGNDAAAYGELIPLATHADLKTLPIDTQCRIYSEMARSATNMGDVEAKYNRTNASHFYDFARINYQSAIVNQELQVSDGRVLMTDRSAPIRLNLIDLGMRWDRLDGEAVARTRLPGWRIRVLEIAGTVTTEPQWMPTIFDAGSLLVEIGLRLRDDGAARVVSTLADIKTFHSPTNRLGTDDVLRCMAHAADILDMAKGQVTDPQSSGIWGKTDVLVVLFNDVRSRTLTANQALSLDLSVQTLGPAIEVLWDGNSAHKKRLLSALNPTPGCGCSVS